jgi:hypothetical protein
MIKPLPQIFNLRERLYHRFSCIIVGMELLLQIAVCVLKMSVASRGKMPLINMLDSTLLDIRAWLCCLCLWRGRTIYEEP